MNETFGFGAALAHLDGGRRVCRQGWNGKGMFLYLVRSWGSPLESNYAACLNHLPFIAMKTADDKVVPWLASQTDILAQDWMVAL
jgi:hypothetical protein